MGYGDERENTVLELTHNWDQDNRIHMDLVLGIWRLPSLIFTPFAAKWRERGISIPRAPGPMQHGTTVIAFIEDPERL